MRTPYEHVTIQTFHFTKSTAQFTKLCCFRASSPSTLAVNQKCIAMKVFQKIRKSWLANGAAICTSLVMIISCTNAQANAPTAPTPPSEKSIKIALLLDTSNSMDGLINQAKAQLWRIVNRLSEAECEGEVPTLQIALYEYGNDRLVSSEGYIRQVVGLTNDLDLISSELFRLTTNGGSEFCGHVIQTSLNQLEWDDADDLQMIFIAGNEPFSQGSVSYVEACTRALQSGVVVNTIFCGDFNQGINQMWKHGADITSGSYMSINQNSQTVFIPSPYDDQITQLNSQLNTTYIGYGVQGNARMQMQVAQDEAAESIATENLVQRAASKSTFNYSNGHWDLVDAYRDETVDLDGIDQETLPEEFRGMSTEELEEAIEAKMEERQQIQAQILELNQLREDFVAQEQANLSRESQLGAVMLQAIQEQAESKNFVFPE